MERKRCESIIHDHECDLYVTMVGWVDVANSDQGPLLLTWFNFIPSMDK